QSSLGNVARQQGQPERAWAMFEEASARLRELGEGADVAQSLVGLGDVLRDRGDRGGAARLYRDAVHPWQQRGHRAGLVALLDRFAALAVTTGGAEQAARLLGAGDRMREQLG